MRSSILLLLARSAFALPFFGRNKLQAFGHDNLPERWSPEFWYKVSISALLVLAGGVFAGYVVGSQVDAQHNGLTAAMSG